MNTINVLFICSMNRWRSPTAENVFRRVEGIQARSAGTSRKARRHVTIDDIRWANMICVMEQKHLSRLRGDFRGELTQKTVHVLDIPDDYTYMDPALVTLLSEAMEPLFEKRT